MITAPKDCVLIGLDLSQAETWIVATLADERTMKDALLHSDIHIVTASALFLPNSNCSHEWSKVKGGGYCRICKANISPDERYLGKKNNHANSYRQSPPQLVRSVNGESDQPPYLTITLKQAVSYNKAWHGLYFGIKGWWRKIESDLGPERTLTTPYGRKRTFYDFWGESLFREATAYVPQSTVGDHALGAVQDELGITGGILGISKIPEVIKYCKIINSAHDSVLIECPITALDDIANKAYNQFHRPLIVNGESVTIPVDIEYGPRWGELEKYTIK